MNDLATLRPIISANCELTTLVTGAACASSYPSAVCASSCPTACPTTSARASVSIHEEEKTWMGMVVHHKGLLFATIPLTDLAVEPNDDSAANTTGDGGSVGGRASPHTWLSLGNAATKWFFAKTDAD